MLSENRGWLRIVVALAVVALVGAMAAGCEQDREQARVPEMADPADAPPATADGEVGASAEIIKVDSSNFNQIVLASEIPVLVDFYADWCGPCRALHPTLEELARDYAGRAKIAQVNVDDSGDLASRYNVRGIPALFVIKGGQTVDNTVGLQSKADLQRMLDKHL